MEEIGRLYQKFLRKECTREEAELLLEYFQRQEHADAIQELIAVELAKPDGFSNEKEDLQAVERNRERLKEAILGTGNPTAVRRILYPYQLVAAGILLASALAFWFYQRSNLAVESQLTSVYGDDVLPGTNRATLTFEDGTAIPLNESHTGIVADGTQIQYDDGVEVVEQIPNVEYATLTTPRGGQYQITLPDGSKVWLNAASTLRYPTSFQNERRVELTGEGYFDVTPDAKRPFVVVSEGQEVKVLGTAFNINGYDQNTITTLIQGKVALSNDAGNVVQLRPNEQAILETNAFVVHPVAVTDYTAWMEGLIVLNEASLAETIKQVERWYDVDFILPNDLKNIERAYISIDRSEKLSYVLKAMEHTYGMQFTIKGREVIGKH